MPRPRVHIVDDDARICAELGEALRASGYECSWATSADRLTGPDNRDPDILLLDLKLPDIDGFEAIERLAEWLHPPTLVVASGQEQRIVEAAIRHAKEMDLNVLGSLRKPYPISSLVALLEEHRAAAQKAPTLDATAIRDFARSGALESNLRTAFQSKRRLSDGAIAGYEALLRISKDGLTINPEAVFTPEVGLATQLAVTKAVLDDALRFGADLRSAGTPATVAVNCTPEVLCAPELRGIVTDALERWRIPAASLMIEITEQAAVRSFDAVASAASRLAMRGCGISIDDFGRGTTSLERLFDLPLTELKIDKQIFWKCVEGREAWGLLTEVMRYCEKRGITSTIEGIETAAHLDHAVSLGASCGQGFLWDRPRLYARGTALNADRPSAREAAR